MKINVDDAAELAELDQTYAELVDQCRVHLHGALLAYRENHSKAVVASLALLVLMKARLDASALRALAAVALAEYAEAVSR